MVVYKVINRIRGLSWGTLGLRVGCIFGQKDDIIKELSASFLGLHSALVRCNQFEESLERSTYGTPYPRARCL